MDVMISKLSEIELAATSIVENAKQKKDDIFRETDEKKKDIDKDAEEEIVQRIEKLKKEMEEKKEKDITELKKCVQSSIRNISDTYNNQHEQIAGSIAERIIKNVQP
ncbi:MAG TPA: hypothetical protein PLU43_00875 [Lachnospiraceae bacterium]|nr:hypothetical protein [Lachnospiraceae bacterium]